MSFNPSVIPPTDRSPKAMAAHIEIYKKSLDTWRIYNPTDKDYVCHFDKFGANEKWIVPNKNKDIGHGKGMQDVPQYIMTRYLNQMGVEMINKKSKEDWDKKKVEFRIEDRSRMEESMAIRTNSQEEWDKITPLLVKGIVSRYGGDEIEEVEELAVPENRNQSLGENALERLGMDTLVIEQENIDKSKENLINQIQ